MGDWIFVHVVGINKNMIRSYVKYQEGEECEEENDANERPNQEWGLQLFAPNLQVTAIGGGISWLHSIENIQIEI